jgi:hypothetical protein
LLSIWLIDKTTDSDILMMVIWQLIRKFFIHTPRTLVVIVESSQITVSIQIHVQSNNR